MRTAILGSCVTRDAFAAHEEVLGKPDWYFARSGLPSAMSELVFEGVDVSAIESPFQRAVVSTDLDGSFARFLPKAEYDLLVYDPIDERFPLFIADSGAIATRSSEFTRAVADVESCVRLEPLSEGYYELWEPAWQHLVEVMTRSGNLDRLRVNQVYWAHLIDGPGEFPAIYPAEKIRRANDFLERLYTRMLEDLPPHRFFRYAEEELVAAGEHRWGIAPFHYVPAYYQRLCDYLVAYPDDEGGGEAPGDAGGRFGRVRRWLVSRGSSASR